MLADMGHNAVGHQPCIGEPGTAIYARPGLLGRVGLVRRLGVVGRPRVGGLHRDGRGNGDHTQIALGVVRRRRFTPCHAVESVDRHPPDMPPDGNALNTDRRKVVSVCRGLAANITLRDAPRRWRRNTGLARGRGALPSTWSSARPRLRSRPPSAGSGRTIPPADPPDRARSAGPVPRRAERDTGQDRGPPAARSRRGPRSWPRRSCGR